MSKKERFKRHLICNPFDVPLHLIESNGQDTFMYSMCYRLYESTTLQKRQMLRMRLLLHMCSIAFGKSFPSVDNVIQNKRYLTLAPEAHKHPAIQYWCKKMGVRGQASDLILENVFQFLYKNKKSGHCSCRYTMSALVADRFKLNVYIYENTDEPICIKYTSPLGMKEMSKNYSVYIWYDRHCFHLLLPVVATTMQDAIWFKKKGASTRHVDYHDACYTLVRSYEGEIHEITHLAPPIQKDYSVHVGVVPSESWRSIPEQMYMILPPRQKKRTTMDIPKGQQLFVYAIENNEIGYQVSYMEYKSDKAIFQLEDNVVLVCVVCAINEQEADMAIREEMKVKVERV